MNETVLILGSDSSELKKVREEISRYLARGAWEEKACEDILVAIGEACTNSIRHAYANEKGHEMRITIQEDPHKIVFRIRDFGKKIDLTKINPAPQLPPVKPHGLGVYFMQTIMDGVEYNTSHSEGNEIILTKYKQQGVPRENPNQQR